MEFEAAPRPRHSTGTAAAPAPTSGNSSVLCHLGVHRGLGHLSRQATILRHLRTLRPGVDIAFHLARPDAHVLAPEEFPVLLGDAESPAALLAAIHARRPDVLVFDTFLPAVRPAAEAFPDGEPPAIALTLRKVFPERLRPILANPWMDWVQLLLVPHDREEFAPRIEERRHARIVHTGTVVRPSSADQQSAALARCGLAPGEPFLLATTGGGGIPVYFEQFSSCIFRGLQMARRTLPAGTRLPRCVFVTGPLNSAPDPVPDGVTCVAFEPDLPALMAAARLVIAHTGYNTTEELLASGTPAIFLPMITKYDDGLARARRCASLGTARVVEGLDPVHLGEVLASVLGRPELLGAMRRAFHRIPRPQGAERAAAALDALLDHRDDQVRAVSRPLGGTPRGGTLPRAEGDAVVRRLADGASRPFVVPVLQYRSVGEGTDAPGRVDRESFIAQLDWIVRYARPGTPGAFLAQLERGEGPGPGGLIVTFDEAYAQTFHVVAPLLRERGIRAVFFLPTRHLGRWDAWNARSPHLRPHFGWDDAAALVEAGHLCGVHGRSHHALTKFDRDEIKKELQGAIHDVEGRVGVRPRLVAYPHGAVNPLVLAVAKRLFDLGFVSSGGCRTGVADAPQGNPSDLADWSQHRLTLPRIPVMPHWRLPEFAQAVHWGAGFATL